MDQERLASVLKTLDSCQLECDGMTRIISCILQSAEISHIVRVGTLTNVRTSKTIEPHLWIELQDGTVIDFRAKMWLGNEVDIPHGVFTPEKWTQVGYTGQETTTYPLADSIARLLARINGIDIDALVAQLTDQEEHNSTL
ncbi:hypothetical protein [Paenibacillus periandrae]|uniref:hypothetical protein n=1 Tax=Paenibacillus periandrae TaxID=1761741 RepID=UPI001F09825D|nr:hypothetical protein [Paenibacillus periandrae]